MVIENYQISHRRTTKVNNYLVNHSKMIGYSSLTNMPNLDKKENPMLNVKIPKYANNPRKTSQISRNLTKEKKKYQSGTKVQNGYLNSEENVNEFESNDLPRKDYITRNFLNPINLMKANGKSRSRRIKKDNGRSKTFYDGFNTNMNIEESQEFESVNYKPK